MTGVDELVMTFHELIDTIESATNAPWDRSLEVDQEQRDLEGTWWRVSWPEKTERPRFDNSAVYEGPARLSDLLQRRNQRNGSSREGN